MVSHRDLRHLKSGFHIIVRIVPIVSIASKNLRAIGMIETIRAIMLKSLDRPKRAVLQVKGRRAGLGVAAVYLKGTKKYCQESTVLGIREIFKKNEQLGMYKTYYTETHAFLPLS